MFSLKKVAEYEIDPFDLGKGQIINFRQYRDFNVNEIATWERVRRRVAQLGKQRDQANTQSKHEQLTKESQAACLEMIHLCLPELPEAVLAGLQPGQIDNLAAICITVASGTYRRGQADAADVKTCREMYPNLPPEFWDSVTAEQVKTLLGGDVQEPGPNG